MAGTSLTPYRKKQDKTPKNAFARGDSKVEMPEVEEDAPVPTLAQAEWEHIHRILADCGGNISEAARRLGIHRRSLQRKLRKRAP